MSYICVLSLGGYPGSDCHSTTYIDNGIGMYSTRRYFTSLCRGKAFAKGTCTSPGVMGSKPVVIGMNLRLGYRRQSICVSFYLGLGPSILAEVGAPASNGQWDLKLSKCNRVNVTLWYVSCATHLPPSQLKATGHN